MRGALLITSAVTLLVFAVSQGAISGWTSPLVIAAAVTAAAAAAIFVKAEARHPEPLIRLALLHRSALRNATTLAFLMGLWNGGEMLVLSLYLQQVLHESPLFTGLVIAPQGVVGFTMGMLGPRLAAPHRRQAPARADRRRDRRRLRACLRTCPPTATARSCSSSR